MRPHLVKSGHRGGAGHCLACQLPGPDQDRLRQDLLKGVPLARVSRRWNINREALRNHKAKHISPAEVALRAERLVPGTKDSERVGELIEETWAMYESSKKVVNMWLALKCIRELGQLYELHSRLTGELDDRPEVVINVQQTAAFIAVRSVIFDALEPYPEVRAQISRELRVLAKNAIPDATG